MYDVAVIGLGAMGSAATSYLAERGLKVIGLEAAQPAHAESSSHGDSRLIRLGYFEGDDYVPLGHHAYANWRRLEVASGEALLHVTGVLHLGPAGSKIVEGTRRACERHDLPYTALGAAQIRARYPQFAVDDDEVGLFEAQGGYLRPERAVYAYLNLARQAGAALRMGERVSHIDSASSGVTVHTAQGRHQARRAIIATGPWIAELVPQLRGRAQPIKQVVAWYQTPATVNAEPSQMPVFLRDLGEQGSYFGFADIDGDGIKVGRHCHLREAIDPDQPNPAVNAEDLALLDNFVARYLPTWAGRRQRADTCRYTLLPSEDFLVDLHPDDSNLVIASPCSGHGFKFASAIGQALADLASVGGTELPIQSFSFRQHGFT